MRLLAAGADPLGATCFDLDQPESPIRLALKTGQEALARRLLTPEAAQRLRPWPRKLLEAAAAGGTASLLAMMLREPHEQYDLTRPVPDPDLKLTPAVIRVLDEAYARLPPCKEHRTEECS
jgi:hypothetical protein